MPLIPFARQSKAGVRERAYSGERVKNLFLRPADGISSGVLIGRGGAVEYSNTSKTGPVRAITRQGNALIFSASSALYSATGGTATYLGPILDDEATVMASSGTQTAIVAGGRYYVWDGTTLAQHSSGPIDTPKGVAYINQYFLLVGEGGGRKDMIAISALNDATTIETTDFAFAEYETDELKGIFADHGQVLMVGGTTVESWYNSGAASFPFTPNIGGVIEHGCHNGKTVAKADNAVFWVGDDLSVYRGAGGPPQVISSREVEDELADSTITGAFTFRDRGHQFYAIAREADTHLVFEVITGLWHERSTGVGEQEWLCTCRATLGGVDYFGTNDGRIVTLDPDTYEDAGETIEAEAISVPVEQQGKWFSVSRVHAQIRGGVGGIGRTPLVMMETTRDGHTWSNEKTRPLGDTGEHYNLTEWHGLGSFQRFQVRLRITDPVPRDIYGVNYE
jgi:hypothetical protein